MSAPPLSPLWFRTLALLMHKILIIGITVGALAQAAPGQAAQSGSAVG